MAIVRSAVFGYIIGHSSLVLLDEARGSRRCRLRPCSTLATRRRMSDDGDVARVLHHLVEPPRPCSYLDGPRRAARDSREDDVTVARARGAALARVASLRAGLLPAGLRRAAASASPSASTSRRSRRARASDAPRRTPRAPARRERAHRRRRAPRALPPLARAARRGARLGPERRSTPSATRSTSRSRIPPCARWRSAIPTTAIDSSVSASSTRRRTSLSAVYFFWDPERAPRRRWASPTSSRSSTRHARRGCRTCISAIACWAARRSLYKSKYVPHELLVGRPAFGESRPCGSGTA